MRSHDSISIIQHDEDSQSSMHTCKSSFKTATQIQLTPTAAQQTHHTVAAVSIVAKMSSVGTANISTYRL